MSVMLVPCSLDSLSRSAGSRGSSSISLALLVVATICTLSLRTLHCYGTLPAQVVASVQRKDEPVSQDDLLTKRQAQKLLGVSRRKMDQLIADGELHTQQDPLDHRRKLILRSEVDALLRRSVKI